MSGVTILNKSSDENIVRCLDILLPWSVRRKSDPETGLAVRLEHITLVLGRRGTRVQSWANPIPCPEQVAVARPVIIHVPYNGDAYVLSIPLSLFSSIRHHLHVEYVL